MYYGLCCRRPYPTPPKMPPLSSAYIAFPAKTTLGVEGWEGKERGKELESERTKM